MENKINVNTGEEWSRVKGKRDFVSVTDCLDIALDYSSIKPKDNSSVDNLLNFGVVIGVSMENMENIIAFPIMSDVSEIGIRRNVPLDNIKFLAVPADKTEFVNKMVGSKNIKVISMEMQDKFYHTNYLEKFNMLEQEKELTKEYPIYGKKDIAPVVNTRKISKIKEMFKMIKERIHVNTKEINERG